MEMSTLASKLKSLKLEHEQGYDEILPQTLVKKSQQPQEMSLRRSTRESIHAILDDYIVFHQEYEDDISLAEEDLINLCQAMRSSNSKKWIDAMKDEMKSMQENDVLDLVKLLEGVKPIGCKWIFKTKKDSKDNIERYKTRLVAKDFGQKEGVDYKETFSPVSLKDSFRIVMTLVKTAFLNSDIDETIYMVQLENYVRRL
ncbi:hypothetical protein CR513_09331, partial [Mucuna pruriens]